MSEREESGVKCCNCKKIIPGCSTTRDWGWKLGNRMFFCTYSCMRAKRAEMDAKRSETMAKRKAEKEAKKAARKAEKEMTAAVAEEQKMEPAVEEARVVVDSVEEVPGVKLVRMEELTAVQAKFREVQEQHQQLMEKIGGLEAERDELQKQLREAHAWLEQTKIDLIGKVQSVKAQDLQIEQLKERVHKLKEEREMLFARAQSECNVKNDLQKRLNDIDHGFNREQAEHELMAMSENISVLKERQMRLVDAIKALAEVITA